MSDFLHDLVVVGGGLGGLATAGLAQQQGMRVALLESHTRLGGCAGYFPRGAYTFDAGATALMGLDAGEPIGDLLALLSVPFRGELTAGYRVVLPDREVVITPDASTFERRMAAAFPDHAVATRRFWRLQAAVGSKLFHVAGKVPRLPLRTITDALHDARILGPGGILAASTWLATVDDVLKGFGLDGDVPFRALIAMLLQDTAQAGPEVVPFANAATCLHAYRAGMSRPLGGMAALAEGIGRAFAGLGGDLRTATLVDRVERVDGGRFAVLTRRRHRLLARQVAFNLPLDRAASLLGRGIGADDPLAQFEARSRARWSACTAYLAIDRAAIPDDAPLFHQVLQAFDRPIHDGNNVLVSLSPAGDPGYGPPEVRVATLSTHTRPAGWTNLDPATYKAKKADYQGRLLAALGRALPEAARHLIHSEFATPRSFARYTRRTEGAVGGPPVAQSNSVFLAVDADVLGRGLWVVGDSVFPGQGTMATVLSAIRVVERITGQTWSAMRPGLAHDRLPAVGVG